MKIEATIKDQLMDGRPGTKSTILCDFDGAKDSVDVLNFIADAQSAFGERLRTFVREWIKDDKEYAAASAHISSRMLATALGGEPAMNEKIIQYDRIPGKNAPDLVQAPRM